MTFYLAENRWLNCDLQARQRDLSASAILDVSFGSSGPYERSISVQLPGASTTQLVGRTLRVLLPL